MLRIICHTLLMLFLIPFISDAEIIATSQKSGIKLLVSVEELERENKKLKNLSQKENAQKRERFEEQSKNITQNLKASELTGKALDLWKDDECTDIEKALEYFNKAISLDPNYAKAYHNRGIVWANEGNYDRAILDYNKVIELNPVDAKAYNNRGFVWAYKGYYDKSCHNWQKACELGYCSGLNWARKGGYCK